MGLPSVDFMANYTNIGKIPSALITDLELVASARHKFEFLIVSTGMSTEEEIEAVMELEPDVVMHTNSTYPSKVEELNLNYIYHLKEKYPDRDNVKRLIKGYNPKKISETLPTSEYTAYSENKGEKIAFCLNTEKKNGQLIDENTLMFVATHELAHVATKSIGHTEEFWNNFKFLLKEADKINVYKPEDYKKTSRRYCGTDIVDNPYYDL